MPSLPSELTYAPEADVESAILQRNEVVLTNPTPVFKPDGASRIEFRLTTTNFIDLASVELYADIQCHIEGGGTTTLADTDATKLLLNGSMSMFNDITLSTQSGVVIERIDNSMTLGQLLLNSSASGPYLESMGSFSNNQSQVYDRDTCASPTRFRILALKQLGFLASKKFVKPSSFGGGLVISMTMASNAALGVVRNAANDLRVELSNVQVTVDECLVSPAYNDFYTSEYEGKGMRIYFDTWGSQAVNVASGPSRTIPFAAQAKRCKALAAVSRVKGNIGNKLASETAFISTGNPKYAFEVSGARYPQAGVNSYVRAADEVSKFVYSKHDCQRGHLLNYKHFTTDWAASTSADRDSQLAGRYMAFYDAEKLSSSNTTGLTLAPSSCQLSLTQTFAEETEVTVFWNYARAVTLVQGQVMIEY